MQLLVQLLNRDKVGIALRALALSWLIQTCLSSAFWSRKAGLAVVFSRSILPAQWRCKRCARRTSEKEFVNKGILVSSEKGVTQNVTVSVLEIWILMLLGSSIYCWQVPHLRGAIVYILRVGTHGPKIGRTLELWVYSGNSSLYYSQT